MNCRQHSASLLSLALWVALWGGLIPPGIAYGAEGSALSAEVGEAADRALEQALGERFAQLDTLSEMEVSVEAGVVRLRGRSRTSSAREAAESIARRTDGVAEVVNQIEVRRDLRGRLEPAVTKLMELFRASVAFLPLLVVAGLILLVFNWLSRRLAGWERPFSKLSENRFVRDLLQLVVRVFVLLAGVLLALEILDATALVGAVLGAAGVLGLAVGFAFRDLVENFIASALLSIRQPFAPSDFVSIDGHEGKVLRLTSRATVLMTLDGNHLRIPNAKVFKAVILNYTRNPMRRFDFEVGIDRNADAASALEKALDAVRVVPDVLEEPEIWGQIKVMDGVGVRLGIYAWIDQRESSLVGTKSAATVAVREALADAGISSDEPVYRVRTETFGAEPAGTDSRAPERRSERASVRMPARQEEALANQMASEREATEGDDLLNPKGARE